MLSDFNIQNQGNVADWPCFSKVYIAFPLNQQGEDLLMSAPSPVQDKQMKELHIRTAPPIKV